MKVLVIGSGGREHALVWKLLRHAANEVIAAPGNPGIARIARCLPVDPLDPDAVLGLARAEAVDLTVVGPEAPLERGVVDLFMAAGASILGPTQDAARLETSKAFAKDFMARHAVPTARFEVCGTPSDARAIIERAPFGYPMVVKADGLAAGKGVIIAPDAPSAHAAIDRLMVQRTFGDAGSQVVIEEHLTGEEVSFFALCDGSVAVPLVAAQDHKRAYDGDRGPNTGGMGAFAPSALVDEAMRDTILRTIVQPVLTGMRAEGCEFRGFLFCGLMMTDAGPKVIEFNVRLGDPEAQVVLPMLGDDLAMRFRSAAAGRLKTDSLTGRVEPHVGVVMASEGYPGEIVTGRAIHGLDEAERMEGVLVFHAGTASRDGAVATSGGRVLTVVGRGATFEEAIARAYAGVDRISFEGCHVRRDIGGRAIGNRK